MIRTLVVEDDALVAEVHASYVERVPELLSSRPVDLVLLDFHLPDVQGLDMLRALRARTRTPVDVIAVTAARDPESIRQAIAQGVTQYLVKPFAFATFADKLERYAHYRARVASTAEPDQAQVDALIGTLRGSGARTLPKGLNGTTLEHVRSALREAGEPLTASEVAGRCGLSRVTTRRYLEHLAVEGVVDLTMRYGGTGRPEHLYAWPG
jgi:response regulator of citrate/malate metabolism